MSAWDAMTAFASAKTSIADAFDLLKGIQSEIVRGNSLLAENNNLLSTIIQKMDKESNEKGITP